MALRWPLVSRLAPALLLVLLLTAAAPEAAGAALYRTLPRSNDSWYWEIDPPRAGLAGLPPVRGTYPQPGSARIWDTDLFADSNTSGIPTAPSPVVRALHAAGHYSVCYVEVGAFQTGYPDNRNFAAADYGSGARRYQMRGYPNEWWFDVRGFRSYRAGRSSSLTGAARNIAAGLRRRFGWCELERQDAVEPDDIGAYSNKGETGVAGGGWGVTRADELGFERFLSFTAHNDGLAVLQKNDPADASIDSHLFDGVLTEECNRYHDPCAGPGGDWDAYLQLGKPVLDAEYAQDGETTAKFCSADERHGIWGALFSSDLNGDRTYQVCWHGLSMGVTSRGRVGAISRRVGALSQGMGAQRGSARKWMNTTSSTVSTANG